MAAGTEPARPARWWVELLSPRELRDRRLLEGLATLERLLPGRAAEASDEERPLFLWSAGWRSGSTLVQRLLCSDSGTLIWGEPFEESIPVPRLAAMVAAFANPMACRVGDGYDRLSGDGPLDLPGRWIATLNPGLATLRAAHRSFFETLLLEPARRRGFRRWGAKWVRATASHALYLQWLFPGARHVLLVRDPLAAFASYKGHNWYRISPSDRVRRALTFAAHWRLIAESFLTHQRRLGAHLLRYEDLIAKPQALDGLARYCEIEIDPAVLGLRVAGARRRRRVTFADRWILHLLTFDLRRRLGYTAAAAPLADLAADHGGPAGFSAQPM